MSVPLNTALDKLKGYLTSTVDGGSASNLSAIDYSYFSGSDANCYVVKDGFARFFDQAWEVPITDLDGSTSTGIIYIIPKSEANREINENYNSLKWYRNVFVDVVICFLDEGTREQYEEIIFAAFKDALQNPSFDKTILWAKLNSIVRERPPKTGLVVITMEFNLEMKNNVY